jgi:hypothetical protein
LRQAGEFYDKLVKDPRFSATVNDIVVEFGSRLSQPAVDRYIAGEAVPEAELEHVWRDSTKVMSWESPIYAGLLTAVRDANKSLPAKRRLRVLVGDSPIDWPKVQTHEQWEATQPNNRSFSWVIINDVLKQHRKALVILGSNHLTRGGDSWGEPDTTTMVEDQYPHSMFVIMMLPMFSGRGLRGFNFPQPSPQQVAVRQRIEAAGWEPPAIVPAAGWVGDIPAAQQTLNAVADAGLYLGTSDSLTADMGEPASLDPEYRKEVARRLKIVYGCDVDPSKLGMGPRACN